MKHTKLLLTILALTFLVAMQTGTAYAWCTPRILHCGDIIDSSTVRGHDDINRYSCTGSTNWNGKAHVYRINHLGDSLKIRLDWTGNSNHAIGVFVLTSCNQNACIAYNAHELNLKPPAGQYWIIVDSRYDYGTNYRLTVLCGDFRLPVELLSFTSEDARDGVHLAWSTASETDNASFRVERQLQDTDDWSFVGQVTGHTQSTVRENYSFVDNTAQLGQTYAYRLVSVDLNGGQDELQLITASHTAAPAAEIPATFKLIGNYPNPFNPSTQVVFDVAETSQITLSVFDLAGRLVNTLASGTFSAGRHEVTFNAGASPSGVYFARLQTPHGSEMVKMVLMK